MIDKLIYMLLLIKVHMYAEYLLLVVEISYLMRLI